MNEYTIADRGLGDLAAISHHYESRDEEVGRRLILRIRGRCQFLATHPEAGERSDEFGPGIRLFPALPYVIYYRPSPTGVTILRVFHTAQDVKPYMLR